MTRGLTIGLSLAALCGASTLAHARPPTMMHNPGYERRLQESRSQLGSGPVFGAPVVPPATSPKRTKRKARN
jgi:hypothetical protein